MRMLFDSNQSCLNNLFKGGPAHPLQPITLGQTPPDLGHDYDTTILLYIQLR